MGTYLFSQLGDLNSTALPSDTATVFGGAPVASAATIRNDGTIYGEIVASRNPGGTAGDYVVGVYTLPALSFDIARRGVNIVAQGSVANNTNSKRIKMFWGCTSAVVGSVVSGGTLINDTGAYTTTGAAGWALETNVLKYGAAGSNTQLAAVVNCQIGAAASSLIVPVALTAPENAPIIIAITANAATAATDIIYNILLINGAN